MHMQSIFNRIVEVNNGSFPSLKQHTSCVCFLTILSNMMTPFP